ncbi:MAG TPA: hypothetical protein QF423_04545 [Candidatus Scalindua sp.]|nr:hypothetical protein [Candidatus Scalindua sp.]|tara:strand:+ start:664 stop:873 length:210 start_codon:yes stop_codon:yes gene_type:complete
MALSAKRPSRGDNARQRILHEISETNERKRRLNAEIEDTLYKQIKMKAVDEEKTISEITRTLWVEYLNK